MLSNIIDNNPSRCLARFKNAVGTYPQLIPLVRKLATWTDDWIKGVTASPPTFKDSSFNAVAPLIRDHLVRHLKSRIDRLVMVVDREGMRIERSTQEMALSKPWLSTVEINTGIIAALRMNFEGPGSFRHLGPRHNNDAVDICDIRIVPTNEELMSRLPPFLPANFHGAPHVLPDESIERLLDIQFRLLREELVYALFHLS